MTGARGQFARVVGALCAGGVVLAAGCSVALDPDKRQCRSEADCGLFHDKPLYACVSHFCEAVSCSEDRECAARGDFICEADACAPAQCVSDMDCTTRGERCMAGRCADPVFGCFTKKQPLTSDVPASLKLKLLAYGEQRPVRNLSVEVCAAADLACNSPLDVTTSYDDAGMLTIRGLSNGTRYIVHFHGEDSFGQKLLQADYYMQRPVVGETVEADKLEMFPEALAGLLAGSADATFNPEEGLVLAQTFGCDAKPLAGISLSDNRKAFPFYLTGVPSADATETDTMGVGGFMNMEVGVGGKPLQHKLTFSYGGGPLFAFTVAPRPHAVTFVQVYLGDYGTTIERADSPPSAR